MILSLALITIAALTLVALSFTSISSRQKAQDTSAAVLVAEEQLSRTIIEVENFSDDEHDEFWGSSGPDHYRSGDQTMGGTDYHYTITSTEVPTGTSEPNRLRKINVTVWWWSLDPEESRVGSGRLDYNIIRLLREPFRAEE